jgi:hypothetical protein
MSAVFMCTSSLVLQFESRRTFRKCDINSDFVVRVCREQLFSLKCFQKQRRYLIYAGVRYRPRYRLIIVSTSLALYFFVFVCRHFNG